MKEGKKPVEKETKEIQNFKEVEKTIEKPVEKASICFYHVELKGYNQGTIEQIDVKDETSELAFQTLRKIRDMEKSK